MQAAIPQVDPVPSVPRMTSNRANGKRFRSFMRLAAEEVTAPAPYHPHREAAEAEKGAQTAGGDVRKPDQAPAALAPNTKTNGKHVQGEDPPEKAGGGVAAAAASITRVPASIGSPAAPAAPEEICNSGPIRLAAEILPDSVVSPLSISDNVAVAEGVPPAAVDCGAAKGCSCCATAVSAASSAKALHAEKGKPSADDTIPEQKNRGAASSDPPGGPSRIPPPVGNGTTAQPAEAIGIAAGDVAMDDRTVFANRAADPAPVPDLVAAPLTVLQEALAGGIEVDATPGSSGNAVSGESKPVREVADHGDRERVSVLQTEKSALLPNFEGTVSQPAIAPPSGKLGAVSDLIRDRDRQALRDVAVSAEAESARAASLTAAPAPATGKGDASAATQARSDVRPEVAAQPPATMPIATASNMRVVERVGLAELRLGWSSSEFGVIQLRTSISGDHVAATIATSHPGLHAALEAQAPDLEKAFAQHQLKLDGLHVDVRGDGQPGGQGNGGGNSGRSSGSPYPFYAASLSLPSGTAPEVPALAAVFAGAGARLNIRA